MEQKKWSLQIGGRILEIETGLLAGQANGAVTARYGETIVLATAVMSKSASKISGYFPLMVDFEERYYAAGKIKGSRFIKREGRPSDDAILSGRAVDRTVRPLFNARMRNDVQVVCTVLSYDGENDPDVVAIIAASAALSISNIPWNGPVSAVRVGKVGPASTRGDASSTRGGELILNPVNGEVTDGSLDLLVSGTQDKINMIECASKEVPEIEMLEAMKFAQEAIKKIAEFISEIQKEIGKEKSAPALVQGTEEFENKIKELLLSEGLAEALYDKDKKVIEEKTKIISEKISAFIKENYPNEVDKLKEVADIVSEEVSDEIVHKNILEKEMRPDGRKLDEIRHIECKVGILPRTHGTGLFTRGETQALTVTTLGAPGDEQIIDTMEVDMKKRYIHYYNFPPFSVGEVRPMRGPGRREIGHGALAEKALVPVLPSKEEFPYTILLMSEVLSSNGSSSMASTCGSTLSLMNAGVPIKRPVSGIAMGIIVDQESKNTKFKVLTDIQGLEDHYGDMDFKAAGTEKGITALQMDVKLDGVTIEMLEAVLKQSQKNRMEILEKITATIAVPNPEMSQYAPRIIVMHINPEKIRNVIGTGGKIINEIIDETGVEIDIEDDGSVFITSTDKQSAEKAKEWINNLTREVKAGEIFQAKVVKIMAFGAFVELLPGQDGLVHVSEIADRRIEKVEDVLKIGDMVAVKVKEIDSQGRINLTMRGLEKK
ncbi:MAG: polyribonucleotide nucleotidyltransferase [Candidatus Moranbacteria bacterium RIFOXYA12_FULL_35_19]|nr:MAG: Polyribonucleotide nucleotidyltransferase [Candidatus Moranbacteria bacterium GW2011_GWF2_35_39]OGI30723.1 MAG: polyribonucleotide nucleotidyltransferase [Candidatus Moranbacteria bacterium RIFOXYB12_FULL_35_8]OGI33408.1 MAG: polyribonucleotide nucleotidyltransferase [Candidatus Moranbacteria bacterium RIFOXYC12_FULL_36_13]OGI36343.1 MAG: polyribonucleotide nucleotidyltransferase [Candidatus Moranbacteria bacterium RIFOXYA12_FULL_35_19]